jgi:lipopolysaccharide transport system ATP-binding protein
MNDVVIRARGLGKAYALGEGHQRERYLALRDVLADVMRGRWRKAGGGRARAGGPDFWALQEVGFEIRRGEVVGIIGRNGAGKSTLLKILSRITEPSAGRVEIRGRVASLLEVGTGFHPELTGRENVFLNGAILGMTQREIRARFDEIVAFAEVERFLDTPVKRYSSGMYTRLAFAVAAHLEPEILVVDEVLAVGDAEFQKKCLGKMQDVAGGGRTVLFVSHNMAAVQALCARGLLLDGGRLALDADARSAVDAYLAAAGMNRRWNAGPEGAPYRITDVEILDPATLRPTELRTWAPALFRIHYACRYSIEEAGFNLSLATPQGQELFFTASDPDWRMPLSLPAGEGYVDLLIEELMLASGQYVVGAGLARPCREWLVNEKTGMTVGVLPEDVYGCGVPPRVERNPIPFRHNWNLEPSKRGGESASAGV